MLTFLCVCFYCYGAFFFGFLCWGKTKMEAKEAAWRAELSSRLEEERCESERRLTEVQASFEATRNEERQTWQQRLDVLIQKTAQLLADKERLEKSIRQEVDARVQVSSC